MQEFFLSETQDLDSRTEAANVSGLKQRFSEKVTRSSSRGSFLGY